MSNIDHFASQEGVAEVCKQAWPKYWQLATHTLSNLVLHFQSIETIAIFCLNFCLLRFPWIWLKASSGDRLRNAGQDHDKVSLPFKLTDMVWEPSWLYSTHHMMPSFCCSVAGKYLTELIFCSTTANIFEFIFQVGLGFSTSAKFLALTLPLTPDFPILNSFLTCLILLICLGTAYYCLHLEIF